MARRDFAGVKMAHRFERGWNALQIGIEILVTVIVIAGCLGLLGTGPLSGAEATVPDRSIAIDYQRLCRRTVAFDMIIHLLKPVPGPHLEVKLPWTFLDQMDVKSTSPRSSAMRAEADGVTYVFDVGPAGTGKIDLAVQPRGFGFFSAVFVADGARIALDQFIFP